MTSEAPHCLARAHGSACARRLHFFVERFARRSFPLRMSTMEGVFRPAERVASFAETVWHEFSPLSVKYNSCNLGQGFPNWSPPAFVQQNAVNAIQGNIPDLNAAKLINQYARSGGHMSLVRQLAHFYGPKLGRTIDPLTEVLTTAGATEALYGLVTALAGPGDEVVLMEPFFDIYIGSVIMAGAKPVYVPLRSRPSEEGKTRTSADFYIDEDELRAAVNPRTKIIIMCTPHNPTGKVFTRKELEVIADIVRPFPQLTVVSDEVYEFLTYDGVQHTRFATLPGMWDRTLTVSSAGKTFSVTGWKVGWIIGPAPRVQAVARAHQYIIFSVATPLQEAVANSFVEAEKNNFFTTLRDGYQMKRDFLFDTLDEIGLNPARPDGSFFICADISHIKLKDHQGRIGMTNLCPDVHDWRFVRWLTTDVGVTAIPVSSFFSEEHPNSNWVRFAFCKTDEVLEAARERLLTLPEKL